MSFDPAPLSKTAKYKKITKPLLERKRRARINRCLDELKDLMVGALEIDDDNLSKLEKADILELTVNHLTKLHSPKDPVNEAKKFQAGFGQCAAEACRFIMAVPDLDTKVSQNLITHLSRLVTTEPLTIQVPERPSFSPPVSPSSIASDLHHYYSDHDRSSPDKEEQGYALDNGAPQSWNNNNVQQYNGRGLRMKQSTPTVGLLTTVDKLNGHHRVEEQVDTHRSSQYFNRIPIEAKDVILQKIRQHIMDKRGNEFNNNEHTNSSHNEAQYHEETYKTESNCQYYNNNDNATLDLRKVRSPVHHAVDSVSTPEKPETIKPKPLKTSPSIAEDKATTAAFVPEHCELPMDYSNLPPKKKRKLLEYQEYKKQEEARRQLESFYAEKKARHDNMSQSEQELDGSAWRPW